MQTVHKLHARPAFCQATKVDSRRVLGVCGSRLHSVPFSRLKVPLRAATQKDAEEELVDDNVLAFCSLDEGGRKPMSKKTLGELEQEFLEALRSFYFDGQANMTNEEFDNLKEELQWQGSSIVILSSTEQKFLEASLAFQAGKPIMSDEEYDALKGRLRRSNSKVVVQGPRCSIRSRALYSDATPDYLRMTALNIPATLVTLLALFSIDDLTGFEVTKLIELPEPYGIIFLWGLCLPILFLIVNSLTQFVLKDALILTGPCPNCNTENRTYFGDIFTIAGNRNKNMVQCASCKAELSFDNNTRLIKVEKMPAEKKPAAA